MTVTQEKELKMNLVDSLLSYIEDRGSFDNILSLIKVVGNRQLHDKSISQAIVKINTIRQLMQNKSSLSSNYIKEQVTPILEILTK